MNRLPDDNEGLPGRDLYVRIAQSLAQAVSAPPCRLQSSGFVNSQPADDPGTWKPVAELPERFVERGSAADPAIFCIFEDRVFVGIRSGGGYAPWERQAFAHTRQPLNIILNGCEAIETAYFYDGRAGWTLIPLHLPSTLTSADIRGVEVERDGKLLLSRFVQQQSGSKTYQVKIGRINAKGTLIGSVVGASADVPVEIRIGDTVDWALTSAPANLDGPRTFEFDVAGYCVDGVPVKIFISNPFTGVAAGGSPACAFVSEGQHFLFASPRIEDGQCRASLLSWKDGKKRPLALARRTGEVVDLICQVNLDDAPDCRFEGGKNSFSTALDALDVDDLLILGADKSELGRLPSPLKMLDLFQIASPNRAERPDEAQTDNDVGDENAGRMDDDHDGQSQPDKIVSTSFQERLQEADGLLKAKRLMEAEHVFLQLLKEKPASAKVICGLGHVRLEKGEDIAARDCFARAIALSPDLSRAHVGVAKLAEKSGDLEAALASFRRAHSLSPDTVWLAERIRVLSQSLSRAQRPAAKEDANAAFQQRFKYASDLVDSRNLAEAEAVLLELLAGAPTNAPLLCKLGRIASELGRTAEANAYLERAIAANPAYPWSYVRQSEMLEARDDLDAAIKSLEHALQLDETLTTVRDRIQLLRKKQHRLSQCTNGVEIRHWPAQPGADSATVTKLPRDRVTIVAWDLTHNPVGRAMILAEVASAHAECEIVGPMFAANGEDLWPPLRDSIRRFDVRGYSPETFSQFIEGAIRLVAEKPCDVVWVSKPRLPSLLIGYLYKVIHGASIMLDIDDDELAIVRAEEPLGFDAFLAEHGPSDWKEPYSRRWTQLAASLIDSVDVVTACNPVLQRRYGGFLLRHARDAGMFDQARATRAAVRSEFGFSDSDKVVLFLGTPRRHKGVIDVARALQVLADPAVVFCIIGAMPDRSLRQELEELQSVRIVFHPDQPYSRLAELNAMADVVCILQDATNPIAAAQTPAKLTDALATGTVVLATPVPPVLDMMEPGRIVAVSDENLVEALRSAFSAGCNDVEAAEARRAYFRAELSTEVNACRALEAIEVAQHKNKPVPEDFLRLFRHLDESLTELLPDEWVQATKGLLRSGPRAGRLRTLQEGVNLVFLWKQNDSGIFGRRQDMLLSQFAAMPNIRKILHIDAPICIDQLNALALSNVRASPHLGRLIAANTTRRFLGAADDDRVFRRTFVYRGKETRLMGQELPDIASYPNAVEAWLRELDMTDNVLAWVCPVAPHFPEVQKRLGFSFVVSDVIDDQRQWPMHPDWRAQIEKNYRETFACTDAAFANCLPVAKWLEEEGLSPIVVPNGMDVRRGVETWDVPVRLRQLRRPIVGYCGNLSSRIDWDLMDSLAAARPDWSFVLIGEPAKDERCRQTLTRPNVHALGVIPYESALAYVASFDAAIIPHLRSDLSTHMNPLKLYVYRGLGIPVVSAAIANLDDLADDIRVADSPDLFIQLLEEAIEEKRLRGRAYPPSELMQAYSWQSRATSIFAHLETVFQRTQLNTDAGIAA